MNNFQKFTAQVRSRLVVLLIVNNALFIIDWYIVEHVFDLTGYWFFAGLLIVPLLSLTIFPWLTTSYLVKPTKLIWQAVLHIAPDTSNVPAPDLKKSYLGKDLVESLVAHVYQLASVASDIATTTAEDRANLDHEFVATSIPLPVLVLNKEKVITFANQAAAHYVRQERADLIGKNVYSALDMAFTNQQTFDVWLKDATTHKAVASQTWERVRLNLPDTEQSKQPQFDLAAYYNRNNPDGHETMLVMFDHTNQYAQDDQSMSFVALAVHELRTPLTLLRGYIEAFQDELAGKVDPELEDFMKKMSVAAAQLSTFVNTILNVSRIESDQLSIQLHRESWQDILRSVVTTMNARAEVRGIKLALELPEKLPAVGVDRTSITEVMNNLIDNAIKYSGTSDKIVIRTYINRDGQVETTVQDFGVGVPESATTHIFEKFYRNHRNRAQVGGTGLGLYLAKVMVGAHGGHIWVRSKEGEGSTFGFTVLPYNQIADANKTSNNGSVEIVRNAHGWIKNHSMYRR